MVLSENQVKNLITSPKNRDLIKAASDHEDRVLFHSEVVDKAKDSDYYKRYMAYVKGILRIRDKVDSFESVLPVPYPTVSTLNRIQDILKKVFASQDGFREVFAKTPEAAETLSSYLDEIGEPEFWEEDGFTARFGPSNTLIVIDIKNGKPYSYTVPWKAVLDIEMTGDRIEYVVFKMRGKRYMAIDDQGYWIFEYGGGSFDGWPGKTVQLNAQKGDNEPKFISFGSHAWGYCPVNFIVSTPLNTAKNKFTRWSVISPVLGELDWYLFADTIAKNYIIIAAMPPMWAYKKDQSCDREDCMNGFVSAHDPADEYATVACPDCAKRRNENDKLRAGSVFDIDPPTDKDEADLRQPFGRLDADTGSLNFNSQNVDKLEGKIIHSVTGIMPNLVGQEAINEKQAASLLESQKGSLLFTARDMDKTRSWYIDTIGRGLLGEDYLRCVVNSGTDFFLLSESQELTEYGLLRQSGLSRNLLSIKQDQIAQRMVKGKPGLRDRTLILSHIEPLSQSSVDECFKMSLAGGIPQADMIVKQYFSDFIRRFELEEGNIATFNSQSPLKERVKLIKNKIYGYADEKIKDLPDLSAGEPGLSGKTPVPVGDQGRNSGGTVGSVQGRSGKGANS